MASTEELNLDRMFPIARDDGASSFLGKGNRTAIESAVAMAYRKLADRVLKATHKSRERDQAVVDLQKSCLWAMQAIGFDGAAARSFDSGERRDFYDVMLYSAPEVVTYFAGDMKPDTMVVEHETAMRWKGVAETLDKQVEGLQAEIASLRDAVKAAEAKVAG